MELWPSIDLLSGQVVRLHKGEYDKVTVYSDDPVAVAAEFRQWVKHLHVVDLLGARDGLPVQAELVAAVVRSFGHGVEVAGGIRDRATIERYLGAGAQRVVLGTAAIRDPELVRDAAAAFPGRVVLAVDAKDGRVATDGWLAVSTRTAVELVREMASLPLAAVLYTDISRDGTQSGPNFEATARLAREGGLPVLASGGVGSLDDLRRLSEIPGVAGAIVGRAIYEKAFTLKEAAIAASGAG